MLRQFDSDIRVISANTVTMTGRSFPCAIGKGGFSCDKREGDGATPVGRFPIRGIYYRADRLLLPPQDWWLPIKALHENDGWCDAPDDPNYNCHVTHPYPASAENLWREDHVYDLILVVGYNDDPVVSGKGSAIFIHLAREGYTPTAGCVAFEKSDLLEILRRLTPESHLNTETAREVQP